MPSIWSNDDVFPRINGYMIGDKEVVLTIAQVVVEKMPSFKKKTEMNDAYVSYFIERKKGMVLNATNLKTIFKVLGDDYTTWRGSKLVLVALPESKVGRNMVRIIEVRRVIKASQKQKANVEKATQAKIDDTNATLFGDPPPPPPPNNYQETD